MFTVGSWAVGLSETFNVKIMTRPLVFQWNLILKLVCFLQLFDLSAFSPVPRHIEHWALSSGTSEWYQILRLQGAPFQKSPYEYIHEKQKKTLQGNTTNHHPPADILHPIYWDNCGTILLVRHSVRLFWETTGKGNSPVSGCDHALLGPQDLPQSLTSCNLSIRFWY